MNNLKRFAIGSLKIACDGILNIAIPICIFCEHVSLARLSMAIVLNLLYTSVYAIHACRLQNI